jgi:KTSC domain
MRTHTPLDSSAVIHLAHHDDGTLEVHFKSGGIYHYANIPPETFDSITVAKSIGRALHQHILSKGHKGVKVNR